jgi:hypothetical protein
VRGAQREIIRQSLIRQSLIRQSLIRLADQPAATP